MSNERPWNAQDKRRLQELASMQPIECAKLCLAAEIKLGETQGWLKAAEAVISRLNGERTDLLSRLDSLRQNLAVAHSILNDAMAEQDYHVDVSRTAVWLAANERVVEKQEPKP